MDEFLALVGESRPLTDFRTKRNVTKWIHKKAAEQWAMQVTESPRLRDTYLYTGDLKTRGYLNADFRGRQVLTKLRIDDLDLGAAGLMGQIGPTPECQLCGEEPETRAHFVLKCQALAMMRRRNIKAMTLVRGLSDKDAFRTVILARPAGATEDIERATIMGALVHDLWQARSSILKVNGFLR